MNPEKKPFWTPTKLLLTAALLWPVITEASRLLGKIPGLKVWAGDVFGLDAGEVTIAICFVLGVLCVARFVELTVKTILGRVIGFVVGLVVYFYYLAFGVLCAYPPNL